MAIKESELFRGVSQRFITRIANGAEELVFTKNKILFKAGEPAPCFYVLVEGDVHLDMPETDKATLAVSRAGEVFGWSALVEPYIYIATAKCVGDTKVLRIARNQLEAAIKEHPDEGLSVLKNLTGIIAARLRYAYRQLVPEA